MTRFAVLHGHFYQPPREEPWLELVPRELSAAPSHDWNERIAEECYAPLCAAPVLGSDGRIISVLNAYAHCSFDVGPTLLRWLDAHAPAVAESMVAGDRMAATRVGFGNAVAAPYHHIILPLASRRDKVTEVRWGIRDFRRRFGRTPVGMWLPEAAVDDETLEVLAAEGIRFTILAPHQVSAPAPHGQPSRWRGGGGRELAIFTYDGPLSHDVAFTPLMRDLDAWERRFAPEPPDSHSLVALATDGETFGHHHRDGDVALAGLIDRLHRRTDVTLTNFEMLLHEGVPPHEVTLNAPSSWSCAHGVERWRNDCGCRMDAGTSQAWRAPLRAGLDAVKAGIDAVVEREWPAEAGDLWTAREAAGPDLAGVASYPGKARRLLEAEHHALAMFTSCGWFFDDVGRIEPRLILRHAARALEFLPDADRQALEAVLLTALAGAHSNDPAKGSGVDIWKRDVLREADGAARLAAGIAALRELAPAALDDLHLPSHTWRIDGDVVVTVHRRTGAEFRWATTPVTFGVVADRVHVRNLDAAGDTIIPIERYPPPVRAILDAIARPIVLDATLDAASREALRDGLLEGDQLRGLVLSQAWDILHRDGIEQADVIVHGAIDLYRLAERPLPRLVRVDAIARLTALPPGRARTALSDRFGITLPDAAP